MSLRWPSAMERTLPATKKSVLYPNSLLQHTWDHGVEATHRCELWMFNGEKRGRNPPRQRQAVCPNTRQRAIFFKTSNPSGVFKTHTGRFGSINVHYLSKETYHGLRSLWEGIWIAWAWECFFRSTYFTEEEQENLRCHFYKSCEVL